MIIVDNASKEDSIATLKELAGESGLPNLQVYALTNEVDSDAASWVGLENAMSDFFAVIEPMVDDINILPSLLDHAVKGADLSLVRTSKNQYRILPPASAFRFSTHLLQVGSTAFTWPRRNFW